MRRRTVSKPFYGGSSVSLHAPSILWHCFSTICNGSIPRRSNCLNISFPNLRPASDCGRVPGHEVGPPHPLMRTLDVIRQMGAALEEIVLAPLAIEDVNALVADTFRVQKAATWNLAELMYEKTGGNPFFTIQFFLTLADEGLVTFEVDQNAWRWDLARIKAKGYTDNIVVLMS